MENTVEPAYFHAVVRPNSKALAPRFGVMLVAMLLAGAGCQRRVTATRATHTTPTETGGVAVVELFTSEGCSTCPPADELLSALDRDAQAKHLPIFCIALHVDIWNRLGWIDRLSSAAFSRRQQTYAKLAGDEEIYTPMMRINGGPAFVGSDRDTAEERIGKALASPVTAQISGQATADVAGSSVRVEYAVTGAAPDATLMIAVLQSDIVHTITHGENDGKTLRHDCVARVLEPIHLSARNGSSFVNAPVGSIDRSTRVVLFLQQPIDMKIVAAAELPVTFAANDDHS